MGFLHRVWSTYTIGMYAMGGLSPLIALWTGALYSRSLILELMRCWRPREFPMRSQKQRVSSSFIEETWPTVQAKQDKADLVHLGWHPTSSTHPFHTLFLIHFQYILYNNYKWLPLGFVCGSEHVKTYGSCPWCWKLCRLQFNTLSSISVTMCNWFTSHICECICFFYYLCFTY